MNLSDFDYEFPEALIATAPAVPRTRARLLVVPPTGAMVLGTLNHLPAWLEGALLVANDSLVVPMRLHLELDSGGAAELLLLEETFEPGRWLAMGKPGRKLREGRVLQARDGHQLRIVHRNAENGLVTVEANKSKEEMLNWLDQVGEVPLPPYIVKRRQQLAGKSLEQSDDHADYQTSYARHPGSAAAPTAGLHLSSELIADLERHGAELAHVTLHVGLGTFKPVEVEDISCHVMHREPYRVAKDSFLKIAAALESGRSVIAIGTTSFRAIESFFRDHPGDTQARLNACDTWLSTDLYIRPTTRSDRYQSSVFHGLLTNFHQPRSSLLMLICALAGYDRAMEAYQEAVRQNFRLFSYGDASLWWLR